MSKIIGKVIIASVILLSPLTYAKSLKDKLGSTQNGVMAPSNKAELTRTMYDAQNNVDRRRYDDIVSNPEAAHNDHERMIALASREIFILIDRSGSMSSKDNDPTVQHDYNGKNYSWTRWESARVAVKSIMEVALTLDKDAKVEVILWDGILGVLRCERSAATCTRDVDNLFDKHHPRGNTPLSKALKDLYKNRLKGLFAKGEPATVVVLTDGVPDKPESVKKILKHIVKDSNLEKAGRETLAAFSFVQMGDDLGAERFLMDLDDNLIRETGIRVDIVDTKKDDFLFGTGAYLGKTGVGPFALLWDAIYD